jgi:hypothetical protein
MGRTGNMAPGTDDGEPEALPRGAAPNFTAAELEYLDRAIELMGLLVARRLLRRRKDWDPKVRDWVVGRLDYLIGNISGDYDV